MASLDGLRRLAADPDRYPHGTRNRYRAGCDCCACRAAAADYARERYRARAAGLTDAFVDATPIREHLKRLEEAGVGLRQVVRLSGVHFRVVQRIRSGEQQHVRQRLARRLLAVRSVLAPGQRVPAWRAWRMVRMLQREGFTLADIARRLGLRTPRLQHDHGPRARIRVRSHARIERLYRAVVSDEPLEDDNGGT